MKYRALQLSKRHVSTSGSSSRSTSCKSSSTSATSSAKPARSAYLTASLTACTLMSASDIIAQFLESKAHGGKGKEQAAFKWVPLRTLRMASFGAMVIGPYQRWWYSLLARHFPGAGLRNFATKVAANQLLGGPIIMSTVFLWNSALTGQLKQLPGKLESDFLPTLVHGWQFWVPASSANFYLVPLGQQVLFMSTCSFVWNTYLSYAANKG